MLFWEEKGVDAHVLRPLAVARLVPQPPSHRGWTWSTLCTAWQTATTATSAPHHELHLTPRPQAALEGLSLQNVGCSINACKAVEELFQVGAHIQVRLPQGANRGNI